MPSGRITPKQQEILDFLKKEILMKGYPPAVREICEAVHLKSTSSVHSHLETLEKNGYIRRDPTKPRAIEIMGDSFNYLRTETEIASIPVIGTVAAGQPLLAVENITDYFPFPANLLPNKETFILRVKGDSMIPKFEEGDLALVRYQQSVDSGSYAVALIDDDNGVIKRVMYGANWIELQSLNPMYSPRRFEGKDVTRVRIFGLVRKIIKDTDV